MNKQDMTESGDWAKKLEDYATQLEFYNHVCAEPECGGCDERRRRSTTLRAAAAELRRLNFENEQHLTRANQEIAKRERVHPCPDCAAGRREAASVRDLCDPAFTPPAPTRTTTESGDWAAYKREKQLRIQAEQRAEQAEAEARRLREALRRIADSRYGAPNTFGPYDNVMDADDVNETVREALAATRPTEETSHE